MGQKTTKGGFELQELLLLQKKIIPELVEVLERRYTILRAIYYNQPVGRRVLANKLGFGERIIRTETTFLKEQNLIAINSPGMSVTQEGEELVNKLKGLIHEVKGLSNTEEIIKSYLGLKEVIIVPGNVEKNPSVLKVLGKAAAIYLESIIKDNYIIALTGGNTIKEFIDAFPKINNVSNTLIVPARGGMRGKVDTQSSTLAESLAEKLNGSYKLLHIPEKISSELQCNLLKEREIKEVVDNIRKANILIYGIGDAMVMAQKRDMSEEKVKRLKEIGAVGEAFGCYFDKDSNVVSENTTIGINMKDAKKINTHIAVAAGENKVEAIIATMMNNENAVLITDESAAIKIEKFIKEQTN